MKFLVLVAAICLTAASTVHAAECTSQSFSSIDEEAEIKKLETACGPMLNLAKSASNEADAKDVQKKACEDRKCIDALYAATQVFPDCTLRSVNPKTAYAELMANIERECKKLTGASGASDASGASGAPSVSRVPSESRMPSESSASAAAIGFSVATAAVVAVVAQV